MPGDRVLVKNVGLKGKCKLADRWSKDIYFVIDQPNQDLPIFQVKPEFGDERPRLLHRNMLLPFMGLPLQGLSLLLPQLLSKSTSLSLMNIQPPQVCLQITLREGKSMSFRQGVLVVVL